MNEVIMKWTHSYLFYSQPEPVHVDVVNLQLTGAVPYQRLPIAPIPSSVQTFTDIMEHTKLVLLLLLLLLLLLITSLILYYIFRANMLLESRETIHSAAIEQLYKTLLQRVEVEKS